MPLPLEFFLGWRYTRARHSTGFISFISMLSIAGVALGVAALITIVSVMNGFERELHQRILGLEPHVVVKHPRGVDDWRALAAAMESTGDVAAVAPFIAREGLLLEADTVRGVVVRGIEPAAERKLHDLDAVMVAGSLDALRGGEFSVVLGASLAQSLRVGVGDEVVLVVPDPVRTPAGLIPRIKRLKVGGVFDAGVHEYDTAVALVHLDDAARLFRLADRISGLGLRLPQVYAAPTVKQRLAARFAAEVANGLVIEDWTDAHENLFRAIHTEKIAMFVVLTLSIGVAAFNLISTLVMAVSEKQGEIAILRALGLSSRRVMLAFFIHGGIIGLTGIALGATLGVTLALNVETLVAATETAFGFKFFPPDVYYISRIPSDLRMPDVVLTVAAAVVMCLLAPLYPARVASRVAPAQALRHE